MDLGFLQEFFDQWLNLTTGAKVLSMWLASPSPVSQRMLTCVFCVKVLSYYYYALEVKNRKGFFPILVGNFFHFLDSYEGEILKNGNIGLHNLIKSLRLVIVLEIFFQYSNN